MLLTRRLSLLLRNLRDLFTNLGAHAYRQSRSILEDSPSLLFVVLGVVIGIAVNFADGDREVQVRFALTIGAFALVGTLVENELKLTGQLPLAPISRVVLGQISLAVYFYLRSLLAHLGLPGVSRVEVYALLIGAIALFVKRGVVADVARSEPRKPRYAIGTILVAAGVWAAWWISTHTFLSYRSGALQTPSSDPDIHGYLAKLVMTGGKIAYTHAPYADDPQTYPAAFAVLNALWAMISGAPVVKIINCQLALQACLAVGLIVETAASVRRHLGLVTSVTLLGIAHWFFFFPANTESLVLGGTARFAHSALLLWPLAFSIRLSALSEEVGAQPTKLKLLSAIALTTGLAWAAGTNPSHVFVAVPVFIAGLFVLGFGIRARSGAHVTPRAWRRGLGVAVVLLPVLIVSSDPLVAALVRDRKGSTAAAVKSGSDGITRAALKPWPAIRAGLTRVSGTTTLAVFPHGCIKGNKCQLLISRTRRWWPVMGYSAAIMSLLLMGVQHARRRRNGDARGEKDARLWRFVVAILAFGLAGLFVPFTGGFVESLLRGQHSLSSVLLNEYANMGLRTASAYLYFFLIAIGVLGLAFLLERLMARFLPRLRHTRTIVLSDVIAGLVLAGGIASTAFVSPADRKALAQVYKAQVTLPPKTTLGWVQHTDVDFVERVERIVPKNERVLLPGIAMRMQRGENWNFPQSTSRALPLYSNTPFAFFLGQGPRQFTPEAYMQRVCKSFDIPWLAENAVKWIIMSEGTFRRTCVHNWDHIRGEYYEEVFRIQDRALYRLRADRVAQSAKDPRLDLPLEGPVAAGPRGEEIRGFAEPRGPYLVSGWACDYGSKAKVTVELELTSRDNPTFRYQEFRQAGLPGSDRIGRACGGSNDHGFSFSPATTPPGVYYARVLAYDGPGKRARLVSDNFLITVPAL